MFWFPKLFQNCPEFGQKSSKNLSENFPEFVPEKSQNRSENGQKMIPKMAQKTFRVRIRKMMSGKRTQYFDRSEMCRSFLSKWQQRGGGGKNLEGTRRNDDAKADCPRIPNNLGGNRSGKLQESHGPRQQQKFEPQFIIYSFLLCFLTEEGVADDAGRTAEETAEETADSEC